MDDLIKQGAEAFKAGDVDTARKLLTEATKQSPDDERAWGWMYNVCVTDKDRIVCLKQMLRINPKNEKANLLLNELLSFDSPLEYSPIKKQKPHRTIYQNRPISTHVESDSDETNDSHSKIIPIISAISLIIVLIILIFGPIWPKNPLGEKIIRQNYFDKYYEEDDSDVYTSMKNMEVMMDDPNSSFNKELSNALAAYDLSLLARELFFYICIGFLLAELLGVIINMAILPDFIWFLCGFLFVVFSLEYLFLSWDIFFTPGPILSLFTSGLFVFLGIKKSKTEST